ncbi:MAG: hypothetical protein QOD93_840 [Acetobacteraceae bacterium]|jgi:hypothetical protein|nr:hypothetical protein [Acetobacteraceae bacterium]
MPHGLVGPETVDRMIAQMPGALHGRSTDFKITVTRIWSLTGAWRMGLGVVLR